MTIFEGKRSERSDHLLSLMRIVAAALFIEHGTQKIFNIPPAAGQAIPYHLLSQNGVAGMLETFGGIALLLGLLTRPVAFLLAGEMAVAYFQVHLRRSFFPIQNRGDNVVLFCFVFLYLAFAGGGAWSLDSVIASVRGSKRLHRAPKDELPARDFPHRAPRGTMTTL